MCAVVGPLLALAVNIVHPRPAWDEVGEHETFLRLAAESDAWAVVHLGLVIAFILFLGAFAALTTSLEGRAGSGLARLGLASAFAATAVSVVQASVDTAIGEVAEDWAAAAPGERADVLRIGGALEDVDFVLLSVELIFFFGVTFVLYGLALLASERYPRWLGWIAIAGGCGGIALGAVQAVQGEASGLTVIVLPAVAGVLSLWLLALGVLLWRDAAATSRS